MKEEKDIVELLCKKDMVAFGYIYDQYAPALYKWIMKFGADSFTAAQILEASFLKIYQDAHLFNPTNSKLFIWMLGITLKQCQDKMGLQKEELVSKLKVRTEVNQQQS